MFLCCLHVDNHPVVFVLSTPIRTQDNLVLALGPFLEEDMVVKMKNIWGQPSILPNDWLLLSMVN